MLWLRRVPDLHGKLAPAGDQLLYSTCVNDGNFEYAQGNAITVDSKGRAYITGSTNGKSLPTTAGAVQPTFPGGGPAAFVMEFDTLQSGAASLLYSTYLGAVSPKVTTGSAGYGIAVDSTGKIYIAGDAGDGLLTTAGAFQPVSPGPDCTWNNGGPCFHAFTAKIDPAVAGPSGLVCSTYVAGTTIIFGSQPDRATSVAVDAAGNAVIAGWTFTSDFPTTPGAFQTKLLTLYSAPGFVAKLKSDGSGLIFSTLFGVTTNGGSDQIVTINSLALDTSGSPVFVGSTRATGLPVTADAFQPTLAGGGPYGHDAFIAKLDPTGGSLIYSSYLGGIGEDGASGVALDAIGDAYVVGSTAASDFPTTPGAFQQKSAGGGADAFVTRFPLGNIFRIIEISPNQGGNAGTVSSVQIWGTGFTSGDIVKLVGRGGTIVASTTELSLSGQLLTVSFDLRGKSPGSYDVAISKPGGTTITRPASFTVDNGGVADVWIDVIGRSIIRGGHEQAYYVIVGNRGNIDANRTRVWVTAPDFVRWRVPDFPLASSGQLAGMIFFAVDVVPPGGSATTIPVFLIAPNTPDFPHPHFELRVMQEVQ